MALMGWPNTDSDVKWLISESVTLIVIFQKWAAKPCSLYFIVSIATARRATVCWRFTGILPCWITPAEPAPTVELILFLWLARLSTGCTASLNTHAVPLVLPEQNVYQQSSCRSTISHEELSGCRKRQRFCCKLIINETQPLNAQFVCRSVLNSGGRCRGGGQPQSQEGQ